MKDKETIEYVNTELLVPFKDHTFKLRDGEEKEQLLESIKSQGTIEPLIVRPSFPAGKYEIISGHRRMEACKELGIENVPAIPFFMCGNYHGNRGTCSSTHYIRADAIEQVVIMELRRLSKCLCDDEDSFAALLADKTNEDMLKEKKHIEGESQKCLARSEQVTELCIRCYEDNVSGKLSDEKFAVFSGKYEAEQLRLKDKITSYRIRLAKVDEVQQSKEKFIAAVRKFMRMDYLTAPLLRELIVRIDVYEVTGTGKNRK